MERYSSIRRCPKIFQTLDKIVLGITGLLVFFYDSEELGSLLPDKCVAPEEIRIIEHEKNGKRWLFTTEDYSLINLRRIKIVRHPNLQITKTPFLDKDYFDKRKIKLHALVAA